MSSIHHLYISHNVPYLPPKICISVVFNFVWDGCKTEMKNKGYAKFWGANKVHYGRCQVAYTCYMFIT